MAERLNHLFQTAPRQYLERIVLFTDALSSDESLAQMRNRSTHHIDLQPLKQRSRATLLSGLHQYRDAPLISYFVAPGNFTLIPKSDPPYRFVFLPEFACCRLLVQTEGADWLKLSVEEGLAGTSSPPEEARHSAYVDSFAFWDQLHGPLVGNIRATAVLVKEAGQPWTVLMQQIVGSAGSEVVRTLVSRPIRYFHHGPAES